MIQRLLIVGAPTEVALEMAYEAAFRRAGVETEIFCPESVLAGLRRSRVLDRVSWSLQYIPASMALERRIARVGDKVTCPKRGHGHTTVIVTGDPTMIVDGQPVARHGDQCACGAILLASQGVAGAGSAAAPAAPQRPNVEAEVARGLVTQQATKAPGAPS